MKMSVTIKFACRSLIDDRIHWHTHTRAILESINNPKHRFLNIFSFFSSSHKLCQTLLQDIYEWEF